MYHATDCRARRVSVVDQQLASGQTSGRYFWHRFSFDGYGEKKDGTAWGHRLPSQPDRGLGRQRDDRAQLADLRRRARRIRAACEQHVGRSRAARPHVGRGNDGYMPPEQVWAPDFAPAGEAGFPLGEGTFSATPLAWSHAQFVRLAWSIDAGRPVEQPSIVATRYARE
jgi:glucoamylase